MTESSSTNDDDLPDLWWLVAVACGAPAVAVGLALDEFLKGMLVGIAIASVGYVAGWYRGHYRTFRFWSVIVSVPGLSGLFVYLLSVHQIRGPVFPLFFAVMLANGGLAIAAFRTAFGS